MAPLLEPSSAAFIAAALLGAAVAVAVLLAIV
jgi:hypothetical protein